MNIILMIKMNFTKDVARDETGIVSLSEILIGLLIIILSLSVFNIVNEIHITLMNLT